jgi:hypothetical protein
MKLKMSDQSRRITAVLPLILAIGLLSVTAEAKTMSCYIGVFRARDLASEKQETTEAYGAQVVDIDLGKGEGGDLETTLGGEKVYVSLSRREFADVYDMDVILLTPEADREPGADSVVSSRQYLVNAGLADEDSWAPNVRKGSELFSPLTTKYGTATLTPKAIAALKQAGQWGTYPFVSPEVPAEALSYVSNAFTDLLARGAVKPADVLGVASYLSCARNQ